VTRATQIADAFRNACLDELDAPKPGNVHGFAAGHRMTASDFIRSADAAAVPLARTGARVGVRILEAVEATFAAVGVNTNLGIILLCAPLAAAAERQSTDLRVALTDVLAALNVEDADLAFRAISRASPAGLGRVAKHDVSAPATITLKQAMAEAADRDRIARQYVSDFADVFELGEPVLAGMLSQARDPRWATLAVYLAFLSAFPDSHIVRKHGATIAEEIRQTASTFGKKFASLTRPDAMLAELLAWDTALKERDINPGTSADLTVATVFAHRLRNILPPHSNSD
jgi:triphosphoribosyl-dephospho-CoA synthase